MIPSTGTGLLIALIFVVPGLVYQFARSRLRGPAPDDASATHRLLRALAVSAALDAMYASTAGPTIVKLLNPNGTTDRSTNVVQHLRGLSLWALLLLFAIPSGLAALDTVRLRLGWTPPFTARLTYDPTPRAWDFAFRDIEPTYVRVLTQDGTWLGGWYGVNSFVSSYPEPREIFIETAHRMGPDGSFGPEQVGTGGMYIRCDDIRAVEFVDGLSEGGDNEEGDGTNPLDEGRGRGDQEVEDHLGSSS